jgi:hypothetical protein
MIDNYKQITGIMNFSIEGTFYLIQLLKRKKDFSDDEMKADNILIKDYFIKSFDHFEKIYPEIKELCDFFNARAYIRLNRCFYDKVGMETLSTIVEYMKLGNWHNIKAAYTTACGRRNYDPEKKWIVDIDSDESIDDEKVLDCIQRANSGFENNIIAKIPTVNGYHYITHPFDAREFYEKFPQVDLHKSNPTLLYKK